MLIFSTKIGDLQKLRDRVLDVQKQAEDKLHVYRCVARRAFLTPRIGEFSTYAGISRSGNVLEIGCCFGTEIRGLLLDGFQAEHVIAVDVTGGYWGLGQQLYGDAPSGVRSIFCDVARQEVSEIKDLYGSIDLVVTMAVFHVLTQQQVENMIQQIHRLLKPGGRLIAYCAGSAVARPWYTEGAEDRDESNTRYLHSADSMTALLKETGFEDLSVQARSTETEKTGAQQDKFANVSGSANCRLMIEARKS